MKDLGFFGTDDGFHGRRRRQGRRNPRAGRELVGGLAPDQAVALARRVVAFYRENGRPPEGLGATIDRVGLDAFTRAVL
jgi:dissimilatory sulfite reductase (desulfoviridin) alpha/beta subunit